ncbi:MAG: hypothetical protein C4337_04740, partial [Armatimonadota bacterium]
MKGGRPPFLSTPEGGGFRAADLVNRTEESYARTENALHEIREVLVSRRSALHLQNAPPGAPGLSPGEEAALAPLHHHVV